jgi:hypothetical protein
MTGSRPQSTSVWQRSRYGATALLLLAALPLFQGSVWGRRGRRHRANTLAERMDDVGQMAASKAPERKLRKAA